MNLMRPLAAIAFAAAALTATQLQAQTVLGGGKGGTSFPIVISQPGSYKLASNLVVSNLATTAIRVEADNVTIDLNGFAILGPNVCNWSAKTCTATAPGGGYGIWTSVVRGLTVRNGTISGFAGAGISAAAFLRVEDVTVANNAGGGVSAGANAQINRVIARHNGTLNGYGSGSGISIDDGSVTNSEASFNLGSGFRHGHLVNVVATYNQGAGLWGQASYLTVHQSRVGQNSGGNFFGNVTSFGNNFCGNQAC